MARDLIGKTLLGKLRVLRELGEGGAGRVYEVEHLVTKHRRALKIIRDELCASGEAVARLVREAAATARIDSSRVVEALDAGRLDDGRAYILMELCEGRSLRAVLAEATSLPEARALGIAREVALALADVHRAGLVHRDIKPENIMISGDDGAVQLLDFGICKLLSHDPAAGETLTREGSLAGTPGYMAPEQFDAGSEIDARTDIWALGVVLFEMLSGRRPFKGKTAAAIASEVHRAAAPPLPEDVDASDRTRSIVARALDRDPALRFGSSDELVAALGGEATGDPAAIDDRWQIVRELGRGGAATVFEVTDTTGGPRRAVKLLSKASKEHGDSVRRMLREAQLARQLGKEHVVGVLESGFDRTRGRHYLVMELCDGETLNQRVGRRGALPTEEALAILRPLAATLDAVHARGVVHRDVKPANVMLGSDGLPRLLDFGIAKVSQDGGEHHTASDVILGTPLYMAPEQAQSEHNVGPAADRYALGQLAFTLLVGRAYFERDSKKGLLPLLGAIGRGASEPASKRAASLDGRLPNGFDSWFRKATALDPRERFASAVGQVDALAQALPDRAGGSRIALWALGLTAVAGAIAASVVLPTAEPASARPTPSATSESIAPPALTVPAPSATVRAAVSASSSARVRSPPPVARPSASASTQRPPDSLF